MSSISAGAGFRQTLELDKALDIGPADLLAALEGQKSRILERTERGVDYNEDPFAPYNDTRPFYWYPAGRVGKKRSHQELRREKNNVKRAARTVGLNSKSISKSGLSIKFPSYRAFKFNYLGRSSVDLRGPRAPHMLQAIVMRATPEEGTIGIYGDEAKRASGHNSDDRPKGMPLRRFFAASEKDETAIGQELADRVTRRLAASIEGWKKDFELGF